MSIFNWASGSNITMPHLGKSWLQSKSVSVLDKLLYYNKVVKLCFYEIVSDYIKREEFESSDSLKYIEVTGGEASSKFPEFCGLWLPSARHSTSDYFTSSVPSPPSNS